VVGDTAKYRTDTIIAYSMLSNFRTVPLFGRNIFIAKFVYEE
jgi:hypothetical protein